jgi:hypothetical protein
MRSWGFKQSNIFDILKTLQRFLSTGSRLIANVVRATSEGLNIRASVDTAACAIPRIADPAHLDTAAGVLIDWDTARSCNKNLKDERMSVNEYLLMDVYRPWMSGGLQIGDSYHRMGH